MTDDGRWGEEKGTDSQRDRETHTQRERRHRPREGTDTPRKGREAQRKRDLKTDGDSDRS